MGLRDIIRRVSQEYKYRKIKSWSLKDVGDFWETVKNYDDINKNMYPYFSRFTNSYELARTYLPRDDYRMLDIQARSGRGSLFWYEKGKIKSSVCVDFSPYLSSLAKRTLTDTGLYSQCFAITAIPLPFEEKSFDFVCSYETVEHVSRYEDFLKDLSRVLKDYGIMIVTCPNRLWGLAHALSAILGINHSEGPHRFLSRKELLKCFAANRLDVIEENSTIIIPFNNRYCINIDKFLTKHIPEILKRYIALRRTFVLKKQP